MEKKIMICCDGTGKEFSQINTNVVKIYALARKDKPDEQICYYDPGVGTGGWDYDKAFLKAMKDRATGSGLQGKINSAYKFLMHCYEPGDRIYLFGFSRGAFTVRSLAGMLHKCGLLDKRLDNMIEYAAKVYNTHGNDAIAEEFKKAFSRTCPVHFIGVWDTVEFLLWDAGDKFHNATLNKEVSFGFHAVALDEKRGTFLPSLWDDRQNVEQVWFAGVHSDVGGGYNNTSLSDIALSWMARKAIAKGLRMNNTEAKAIKGNPLGKAHDSFTGKWRILSERIRTVPSGAKIHKSVEQRIKKGIKPLPEIPDNVQYVNYGNSD